MTEDLQRIGVKVFCASGADIPLTEFIPVFHRWIQAREMGLLLIDVADYSHVPEGPGIMLVAHEGNFSMDESAGERGLAFVRKQPVSGNFAARISTCARAALEVCVKLEGEPEFAGRLKFAGDRVRVYANDRLSAPNDDEAYASWLPHVDAFSSRLFGGARARIERDDRAKERLTAVASVPTMNGAADLLSHLSN